MVKFGRHSFDQRDCGEIFLHIRGDTFLLEVWCPSVRIKGSKAPSIFFKVDNYVQTNDFKEDKVDFSSLFSLNSKKRKLFWSAIERDKLCYVTHLFVHEKLSHGRIADWKRMRKRHLNIIMATQKNNERMFCHMFCAHEITKLS